MTVPARLQALVIDDERDARDDLIALLGAESERVAVLAETGTMAGAEALLARVDYNLVFLDVQLRGGTGFDLVPHVRPDARIVFVTAHDQYALRAFDVNALDYLLKPVAPERLAASLRRLAEPVAPVEATASGRDGMPLRPDDTVYLRTGTVARFVPLREIGAIEAEENYSAARLIDGSRVLLRKTLKAWEETLPHTHFMRVHRTAIVNLERVTSYERDQDEHTLLFVAGVSEPLRASRTLWPDLQNRLGRLRRVVG